MTYDSALRNAQLVADETGCSTLVYVSSHNLTIKPENRYGYEFTLPAFGTRVGERIQPKTHLSISEEQ